MRLRSYLLLVGRPVGHRERLRVSGVGIRILAAHDAANVSVRALQETEVIERAVFPSSGRRRA